MITKRTALLTLLPEGEGANWKPFTKFFEPISQPSLATAVNIAKKQLLKQREVLLSLFPEEEHQHLYASFTQSYHNAFAVSFAHTRKVPASHEDLDICAFSEMILVFGKPTSVDKLNVTWVEHMIPVEQAAEKVRVSDMVWRESFGPDMELKQSKEFTQKIVVDRYEKTH